MIKLLLFSVLASAMSAQWVVHDPVNTAVNSAIQAGQAANQLEILRQWAEQLERMNRQIRQLEDQLAVQQRIRDVMGDPSAAGTQGVLRDLGLPDLARTYGETWREIRRLAEAVDTLRRTADRVFSPLDDRTSLGRDFVRQAAPYRRFAVIEQAADNLEGVAATTDARAVVLQAELAATLEQLRAAPTQAEVDKLSVKVAALNGQLAFVANQRQAAAAQVQLQQVLNDNQAAKEKQDLLEKQIAEERQSLAVANAWQASFQIKPDTYNRP